MSSQPTSPPDSIDLDYDMWAGQFEFVGPTTTATTVENNNNNNNNNNNIILLNNKQQLNNNQIIKFGSDKTVTHKQSTESLEDLNLNFNTQCPIQQNIFNVHNNKQPILIDQETFLSLNPNDFDDIVPSSGPNSLVIIDNKLTEDIYSNDNNNNNNNSNASKLINIDNYSLNKLNNYKLENLKNFKNKLLCNDFEEKSVTDTTPDKNHKMHGFNAELCDNLNEQLELLQRQVTDLADTQNIAEDRTTRTKTEYAVLQARYHMLEEQSRETELRHEERLAEEQKRHRELLARVEREAALQNENCQIKIKNIEIEANALREEAQRLRTLSSKQAAELQRTEEKLELMRDQVVALQQDVDEAKQRERKYEQEKKTTEELMLELSKELERLRAETGPAMPTTSPETIRLEELHQELEEMRQKNRALEEQNEELQAAVLTRGLEEGRHLLNGTLNNLAQELEEMTQAQDSVDSATLASLSQLQKAFQDKEDENARLRNYIDTILLNIVENYPQLLEVKAVQRD